MFDLLIANINLSGWGYNAFFKIQEVTAQSKHTSCYLQPHPVLQPQPKLEVALLPKSCTLSVGQCVYPTARLGTSHVSGLSASATVLLQCLDYGNSRQQQPALCEALPNTFYTQLVQQSPCTAHRDCGGSCYPLLCATPPQPHITYREKSWT